MEAAGVSSAVGSDMAPLIADTSAPVKKKYKARKTMTASCRQQMAALGKRKHSLKLENKVEESRVVLPTETIHQPELNCEANYTAQDLSASKMNKNQGVFPTGLQVSIEVCSYNETWKEITKHSEEISSVLLTPVKNAIHFSHSTHFQVNGKSDAVVKPQLNDLSPVCSPAVTEKKVLSEEHLTIPETVTVQNIKKDCNPADIDDCSPVSEKLNASITLKIVAEDNCLDNTSSVDLVNPLGGLGTDNSNTVLPDDELQGSCNTDTTTALTFITNLPTDSDSGNLAQNCSLSEGKSVYEGIGTKPQNTWNAADVCQRKRAISEISDGPKSKRIKTSQNVLSNKIQSLIETRMQTFFTEAFDERLQDLTQKVNLIQCIGNHAGKFARHLKDLKRLEKRIKHAVEIHHQMTKRSSKQPANCDELPKAETLSASNSVPTAESEVSHARNITTQSLNTDHMDQLVLGDNESEQQSKPEQIKTENSNCSSKKVGNAAMHKIMESIKKHRNKDHSSRRDKRAKVIIDLTDEEKQISDKGLNLNDNSRPHEDLSPLLAPTPEPVVVDNLSTNFKNVEISLKKSIEASGSSENSDGKPSIHKSSKSEKPHDSVDLMKATIKPDTGMLKLPQKPELRLAQVQNPKGIALSWNITSVDPECSPAAAYCLYVHQEDPNCTKKLWKKIGEIKALPLPMACTLTQFVEDTTYNFAMRAKDACGRFGPLCDIQSTTVRHIKSSQDI